MSYDAFTAPAVAASSFVTAPAYPPSAFPSHPPPPKPAGILQPDESAFEWLQRDAASPHAPAALKSLQGSRPLLSMIVGGGIGGGGGGAAEPTMHIGDVCELFGRSGSGKTEISYSAIATNILPKTLCSPALGCTLSLGGFDSGALVLDLDYRFNVGRLVSVLQGAITKAYESHALRRTGGGHSTFSGAHAAAAATPLPPHDSEAYASALLPAQTSLSSFFEGAEWIALRTHLLQSVFLFRAQTPRAALAALRQMDACCDSFLRGKHKTWEAKQQKQQSAQQQQQQLQQQEQRNSFSQDGDEEMKLDAMDPSYNPRLPRGVAAAASAASSSVRASAASAFSRIALVCVDGAASFQWIVKGQQPGYAGMATGMRAVERTSLGAGDYNPTQSLARTLDRASESWFYELFAEGLKSLMHRRALIGIVTKTPASKSAVDRLNESFAHDETLGPSWNSLVRFRVSLRTTQSTTDLASSDPSSLGLREVHLKDIHQASKNPDGQSGTSKFKINITNDGIRSA